MGRIYPVKGLHVLLEALLHVKTPIHLMVVGPSWDSDYMKKIEDMASEVSRVGFHKVTFLGEMDQNALVSMYQRASLVVCPYLYETFSNVVRESLACGTPVVSTGTHLVDACSDGISLSRCNPEDLGNAISQFLDNPELRDKAGREGRAIIERIFSWESVVRDWLKIYGEVAGLRSTAGSISS